MKKLFALAFAGIMCVATLAGCANNGGSNGENDGNEGEPHTHSYVYTEVTGDDKKHKKTCRGCDEIDELVAHDYDGETDLTCDTCGHTRTWFNALSDGTKSNLSADGYVKDKIGDFSQYVGTEAYRQVSTVEELVAAIKDAQYHYTNVWDDETSTYTQIPAEGYTEDNFKGSVHVIEITQDLNLGYYQLSSEAKKDASIVSDFCRNSKNNIKTFTMSDMFTENGISQINLSNMSNLLIYSKNGAKLTHGGFKVTACDRVVFRNLQFDEMWQWEDAASESTGAVGDYDAFGWAYFKISFCGYIWLDHCTFGKSYDGQIDYSDVVYNEKAVNRFAPYGADGGNGLHMSWCRFDAGSDDKDGYIYKMMSKVEENYQANKADDTVVCNYLYYKKLRDIGASFDDILYGLATAQKKGFLCGDNNNETKPEYGYNLKLCVSFSNCVFRDLEDRLPKVRGGNAYMYNCVVDSSRYFAAHGKLKALNATELVKETNTSWKCALTSQGIVCGNGGSVMAENCIYRGIENLVWHNDKKASEEYVTGGYQLINCSYQREKDGEIYVGSTSDKDNKFPTADNGKLKPEYFSWHTLDGKAPFKTSVYELNYLEEVLANANFGAGTNSVMQEKLLNGKY